MNEQPLRILIVEDEPADAELVVRELRKAGIAFVSRLVDSAAEFQRVFADLDPDLVLSDFNMTGFNGLEALALARSLGAPRPFIIVTGSLDEETAAGCIKSGADDYVLKDRIGRLGPAVRAALESRQARDEARRAGEALRRSEADYRRLFESANDGILVFDPETEAILDANPKACETYGFSRDELLGLSLKSLTRDVPRGEAQILRLLEAGVDRDFETLHFRRDGSRVYIEASASVVERDGRPAVLAICRDVTERKQAHEQLQRLAAAVDQAAESIVVTDAGARIVYVNPAFERITGYLRDDVMGARPSILKCGYHDDAHYASLWRTLQRGETWHGHFMNRHRDGHLFQEDATISPVRDGQGAIVSYVSVGRDVTREAALEAQLRQSQKMEAVGKLAAGVAHDFNNLLQALLSQMQSLRARAGTDERIEAVAAECEAVVRRGAALTRQLLLFSRHETMQTERLDLNEALRQLSDLVRRLVRANIAVTIEVGEGSLWIEGDHGQLDQVVMNLVVNASDAMPDGGGLTLRSGREGGGSVFFTVQDTGGGIPAGIRERIFEPFFSTKGAGKGTGLGLSVVHGIVAHHGGRIDVTSAPGEGTTFKIVLPFAGSGEFPAVKAQGEAPAPDGRAHGELVLVVEDEEAARTALAEILKMLGYEVATVGSGEEAGLLPETPAFDVLLTDLVLPGIGGGELAAGLSARWPDLKVILMSGYTEDEAMRHAIGTSTVLFLQKPFGVEELGLKIRAALDSP